MAVGEKERERAVGREESKERANVTEKVHELKRQKKEKEKKEKEKEREKERKREREKEREREMAIESRTKLCGKERKSDTQKVHECMIVDEIDQGMEREREKERKEKERGMQKEKEREKNFVMRFEKEWIFAVSSLSLSNTSPHTPTKPLALPPLPPLLSLLHFFPCLYLSLCHFFLSLSQFVHAFSHSFSVAFLSLSSSPSLQRKAIH